MYYFYHALMYDKSMPQVSKRLLDPEVKQNTLDALSYTLKEIRTKKDADLFLSTVMTDTERLMLAKRIAAAFLLGKGIEQDKISRSLKLTSATITRLKMWISLRSEGFDIIFSKLAKKERESLANDVLQRILKYAVSAAFGRSPKRF